MAFQASTLLKRITAIPWGVGVMGYWGIKEVIESNSGLALAGKVLAGLESELRRLDEIRIAGALEPRIGNGDVVRSYVGLRVLGRTNYEDIELYRSSGYFRRTLSIKRVPSCETLRQRLDASGGQFDAVLKEVNVELLRKGNPARRRPQVGDNVHGLHRAGRVGPAGA